MAGPRGGGRALARALGLPPPVARVRVRRGLGTAMRDGVVLRADHYAPDSATAPTILIRTPYPRIGPVGLVCRAAAGQGFHVLIQSCRGTADSGGAFTPLRHERDDGLDTLDWLRRQPWYSSELYTYGPSYVGYTQWAIAADAGPELRAMAAIVSASQFRDPTYDGGSFSWDTVLTWAELMAAQRTPALRRRMELWRGQRGLRRGLAHLPLVAADEVATGARVAFVREWLHHTTPDDPYWTGLGHHRRRAQVTASVLLVAGWQDIFLPWQLEDHAALRAAGVTSRLVVGDWTHGSVGMQRRALRESLAWFHGQPPRRSTVEFEIGGRWRAVPDWPPPSRSTTWYLTAGGGLVAGGDPAPSSPPDSFRYDPADPTPSVGGPRLVAKLAGRRDNRALEARADVPTYTGPPLSAALDVAGAVSATVYIRSELAHFDVFVRLCDVDRRGRSWNVCDGLTRITPQTSTPDGGGVHAVAVRLWPTAYRFAAGHRLRVQVSGGAHPRYARNPGTGEPLGTAVGLRAGWRELPYGPAYPSALTVPVISG